VELQESLDQLRNQGLGLAAISYDSPAILRNFAQRRGITYPLLSDADSDVIRAFGILNEEVPKDSSFYGVPHPVTYIVDAKGVIKSRHFEEDYRQRYTVGNILTEVFDARTGVVTTQFKNERIAISTSTSNAVVRAGERIRLVIDIQLPPKMHAYAPGVKGYIPIEWTVNETPAFEALPPEYPKASTRHLPAIGETVPVYEGKFSIEQEIVLKQPKDVKPLLLPDSVLSLGGRLRYQLCDDKKCYIPESLPLKWTFRFEPHDSTRVPEALRRKSGP
jgi:hypothetical protein